MTAGDGLKIKKCKVHEVVHTLSGRAGLPWARAVPGLPDGATSECASLLVLHAMSMLCLSMQE